MNSLQAKFVQEALDNLDVLTEWENDFINSIAERDGDLSEKQNAILNRIQKKLHDQNRL